MSNKVIGKITPEHNRKANAGVNIDPAAARNFKVGYLNAIENCRSFSPPEMDELMQEKILQDMIKEGFLYQTSYGEEGLTNEGRDFLHNARFPNSQNTNPIEPI